MKKPLFEYPSYQYEVSDWDFKKISSKKKQSSENEFQNF